MLHMLMGKEPWFRVGDHALGAAVPVKWQGWVLIASFLLVVAGIARLAGAGDAPGRAMAFGLLLLVTGIFVIVWRKRTKAG